GGENFNSCSSKFAENLIQKFSYSPNKQLFCYNESAGFNGGQCFVRAPNDSTCSNYPSFG
ncbi:8410_t:CDS:1, partial [Cetraspora pellucida]